MRTQQLQRPFHPRAVMTLLPVFCRERRPFWLSGFSGGLSWKSIVSNPTTCSSTDRTSSATASLTNISPVCLSGQCASIPSKDPAVRAREGSPRNLWWLQQRLCGTECMSWKGCCLYSSEPLGVNLDEGVKQVLSVEDSQPIRGAEIRVQGFRGSVYQKVPLLP